MATITPNTDIYLLKCPLEIDMANQLTFSNSTAQSEYFLSLPKKLAEDNSYQRKDGTIRFEGHIDTLLEYNYVMYKNANYTDKWFYAFITGMDYLGDRVTAIHIETDPYQTYMFDLQLKPSFVEREHVSDDTVGAHTLDEGLNTGEYVMNGTGTANYLSNIADAWIAVQCSDLPAPFRKAAYGSGTPRPPMLGGVPQGTFFFLLELANRENITNFTKTFDAFGMGDAITAMYILPKSFAPDPAGFSWEGQDSLGDTWGFDYYVMPTSTSATTLWESYFTRNTTIDGYVPVNSKLFCYPYNYMLLSNNDGDQAIFHWEDFSSNQAQFKVISVPTQGCPIKILPKNYKGQTSTEQGYLYSMNARTLPLVSWNSDYYLNWQAQNGIRSGAGATEQFASDFGKGLAKNTSTGDIGDSIKSLGNITSSDIQKGVSSTLHFLGQTFGSIFNEVSGGYSASLVPDQAKGQANGDITFSYGQTNFREYDMSIKAETARMIDSYFSMYGYRVSTVKVPNVTGRPNWNFVKTSECNVEGNIPQEYIQTIKQMFNNGVTFWHNPATFLDYSQNNK